MSDCSNARSIGALSPCKMQTKPLNLNILSFNEEPAWRMKWGRSRRRSAQPIATAKLAP